jgi:aquaporin Z
VTRALVMTVQVRDSWRSFWRLFLSEAIGTALLLLIGLSLVIVMFATGSPMARLLPSEGWRQMITGFLFGSTGALIALPVLGKESGAYLNPVVTLAFWLMRKLESRVAVGYAIAQFVGASVGVLPLLLWGAMGRASDSVRRHKAPATR